MNIVCTFFFNFEESELFSDMSSLMLVNFHSLLSVGRRKDPDTIRGQEGDS